MKKTLLSIFTLLTLTITASINITSADVKWVVGNTWTMNVTSGVSIANFTNTGTGVSWDLTTYAGSSTVDTVKILNKTAGANSTIKIQSDIIAGANYEPLTDDWGMETGEALGAEFMFLSGSHALGFPHSEGDTWSMNASNLNGSDITTVVDASFSVTSSGAVSSLNTAIENVATHRAKVGANIQRLHFNSDQIAVLNENLSASVSRIKDIDVAEESMSYARYNILVQSGTAMLAQANMIPQNALRLIQ